MHSLGGAAARDPRKGYDDAIKTSGDGVGGGGADPSGQEESLGRLEDAAHPLLTALLPGLAAQGRGLGRHIGSVDHGQDPHGRKREQSSHPIDKREGCSYIWNVSSPHVPSAAGGRPIPPLLHS